jgi:2-(1,2-epoxy-1,2-dihydrophenyl)acetyl-CoA isomerase
MSETETAGLRVVRDGPVLRLHLDRPDKRNAMTDSMVARMIESIEAAGQDEAVRVIALSAEGEHFCTGFDVVSRNAPGAARPRVGSIQRRLPLQAHRLIPSMLRVQTPIVCVARGWVSGLGLHMALAADFTLVAEDARLWEPFVPRGFTPDSGGSWLLARLAGVARAKDMLILGREVSGREAADWGLVHAATDEAALGNEAEAVVSKLAAAPTVAVGLAKWLVNQAAESGLDAGLANEAFALELSSRSRDFKEGLAAFIEKRDPRYEGK